MQKFIWLILAFVALNAGVALAKGDSCKARVKDNTQYAEWGVQLRQEILKKCGSNPSKSCEKQYQSLLTEQTEKLRVEAEKAFPNATENNPAFIESVARRSDKMLAARMGMDREYNLSAKDIVAVLYDLCMGFPSTKQKSAARGSRDMPPMPPPMMPMQSTIPMPMSQPGLNIGGMPQGGCTNYTVMGQNGQAVYCNKCCYGDGNCQVICN